MTLFQKILDKELAATILYENAHLIVIEDIAPQAPFHALIIPRIPVASLDQASAEALEVLVHVGRAAQKIAKMYQLESFRLVNNCGSAAGQTIFHWHFHLLSGKKMDRMV